MSDVSSSRPSESQLKSAAIVFNHTKQFRQIQNIHNIMKIRFIKPHTARKLKLTTEFRKIHKKNRESSQEKSLSAYPIVSWNVLSFSQ
jgi:hypothetical protein